MARHRSLFIPEASLQFIVSADVEEREGDIHNTCRIIDADFIDLMKEVAGENKRQLDLWPPAKFFISTATNCTDQSRRHNCMEEGDEIRRRAEELSAAVKKSVGGGGR
ncbi:hypothetical protein ACP275_10G170000 [Erythranthe tilingii]